MLRPTWSPCVGLALLFHTSTVGTAQAPKGAGALPLIGEWVVESAETMGRKFDGLKGRAFHAAIGTYRLEMSAKRVEEGTYVSDPAASPARFDMSPTKGVGQDRIMPGIYERTKDRLRICYDRSGKARPTKFLVRRLHVASLVFQRPARCVTEEVPEMLLQHFLEVSPQLGQLHEVFLGSLATNSQSVEMILFGSDACSLPFRRKQSTEFGPQDTIRTTAMIAFSCPQCGKLFNLKDEFAGRATTCSGCKAPLVIPSPGPKPIQAPHP